MSEATTIPGRAPVAELPEGPEVVLERLKDPTYLPNYAELVGLGGDHAEEGWHRLVGREHGGYRRCEVFTQEYIAALADWLVAERNRIDGTGRFRILETGAGDGNLSYFLEREFSARGESGILLTCTDSGDSGLASLTSEHHVEYLDAGMAVQTFRPDLVIQSWMPWNTDLSDTFRMAESVQTYVLIGPADSHVCGREWETWGVGPLPESAVPAGWRISRPGGLEPVPPHQADGFVKTRLELGPQLNYHSLHSNEDVSATFGFSRN